GKQSGVPSLALGIICFPRWTTHCSDGGLLKSSPLVVGAQDLRTAPDPDANALLGNHNAAQDDDNDGRETTGNECNCDFTGEFKTSDSCRRRCASRQSQHPVSRCFH